MAKELDKIKKILDIDHDPKLALYDFIQETEDKFDNLQGSVEKTEQIIEKKIVEIRNSVARTIGEIGPTGATGPAGKDGIDGRDGKDGKDGLDGLDGSPDKPKDIVKKLESLKGEKRLDAKAIKNLPEAIHTLGGGGGGKAIHAGANIQVTLDGNGEYVISALSIEDFLTPTVTLSGGSINEIGITVSNVTLTWVCNKTMDSRVLSSPVPSGDRDRGTGKDGSYIHDGANLTTNTTYTITVTDLGTSATSTTSVLFKPKVYWGVSSLTSLNNSEILALSGALATTNSQDLTFNCNAEYIYYIHPTYFGAPDFYVNGNIDTNWDLTVQTVTNVNGYALSYNVYKTKELQHGSNIKVLIK